MFTGFVTGITDTFLRGELSALLKEGKTKCKVRYVVYAGFTEVTAICEM